MSLKARTASLLLTLTLLTACVTSPASQPDPANLQATIAAQQTIIAAQQSQPTAPPASPAPPTAPPATQVPTAPSLPTPTTAAPATAAASSATAPSAGLSGNAPAAPAPVAFGPGNGDGPQTTNIQLVFDASGSMAQDIGGSTKIAAARAAMERVIDELPGDAANFNVGFRVFGHKGDNTEAGRAESCQSTELLVPMQGINKELLRQQTQAFEPTGWTPITLALTEAGKDLQAGPQVRNVIIMVTDGEETCQGDPCALSKALAESQAQVRIDVVGFGTTPEESANLRCISDNSGGSYTNVQDGAGLTQTLQDLIAQTVKRSYLTIRAVGPDGKILARGHGQHSILKLERLEDQNGPVTGLPDNIIDTPGKSTSGVNNFGQQRIELPPGTYRFTIWQELGGPSNDNPNSADAPEANVRATYTAQVVEGQETVATIGVGALKLTNGGIPPDDICQYALQVAVDGKWETAYEPNSGCDRGTGQTFGYGQGFYFDAEYSLMPGIYRLINIEKQRVMAENIVIEPGKVVRVSITP
ncbi:MAG: VWA domain-containing protein [Chloroflexaceae bacterium]|jgi:Mg-chelatase subunit ChlD|nr:VWA domain-containing protein [Chloroflexaceae bacterium]